MLIRQLEYFVAVARERHFARAAAACYVSQPALSEALRKLENELGVPLIQRGHVFERLTPEGERLVVWARRVLADHDQMVSEARTLKAGLTGHLRIGVMPSGSTTIADLVADFWREHPLATVSVESDLSTDELVRRLRAFELDVVLCYEPSDVAGLVGVPFYRERPVLLASPTLLPEAPDTMTWAEAAAYPLTTLDTSMRGRAVVDAAFAAAGVTPSISVETDSIASLHALVRTGLWAGVVPDRWHVVAGDSDDLQAVRLTEPEVEGPVLLVRLDADPVPPLLRALDAVVGSTRDL